MFDDDDTDMTQEEWEAAAWDDFEAEQRADGREYIASIPLDDAPF